MVEFIEYFQEMAHVSGNSVERGDQNDIHEQFQIGAALPVRGGHKGCVSGCWSPVDTRA
jgi:hypothetical protein